MRTSSPRPSPAPPAVRGPARSRTPAPARAAAVPRAAAARDDLAQLQQSLYRQQQRQIAQWVAAPSPALAAYARRYRRAVAQAEGRANWRAVVAAARASEVTLVGDYHPLPACRAWALRLVEALRQGGPMTLALEYFRVRDQPWLNAFAAGRIDEATLRRRTQHAGTPLPGAADWDSFRPLLALVRQGGLTLLGLDSRGLGAGSLPARDARAARCLARALARAPGRPVLALVGQMHLAPGHLPRALQAALGRRPSLCVVYQNCEQLGLRGPVGDILALGRRRFALQHTSPLACQQAYLAQLVGEGGPPLAPTPKAAFVGAVRRLTAALQLPRPSAAALARVQVHGGADVAFLAPLRRRLTAQAWRHVVGQVGRGHSVFVAAADVVYLANLTPGVVGEEAAHYLRFCGQGRTPPPRQQNGAQLFCHHAFEEALGFVGGALLQPARRAPGTRQLRRLAVDGTAAQRQVARSALTHLALQAGRPLPGVRPFGGSQRVLDAAAHVCGYRLGALLVARLRRGAVTPRQLGQLFAWAQAPLANYLGLVAWLQPGGRG